MVFGGMKSLLRSVAVDLGTVNTLVALRGKGIVLKEPSVVAQSALEESVPLAFGSDALSMAGRTPGGIIVAWPLKDGVIADYALSAGMLRHFISKARGVRNGALGIRLALCLPLCATDVERRAIEEAAKAVGTRDALIVDEPVAAAVGAGLPVFEPIGSMIVDIGGGTTDIAVLSLGGCASSLSLRVGGRHIDAAISDYVAKQYSLMLGERTAEEVKLTLASALPGGLERMQAHGRSIKSGLPASTVLNSGEISHAAVPVIRRITEGIKQVLSQTPPELAADLIKTGITLSGGGALLPGLCRLISQETGLRVSIAKDPLDCVATGALTLLENDGSFERVGYA